jgi:hypothetical protein
MATRSSPGPKLPARPRSAGYGKEGTNKTVPQPEPQAKPAEELLGTPVKHAEKSPYTRG